MTGYSVKSSDVRVKSSEVEEFFLAGPVIKGETGIFKKIKFKHESL